MLTVLAAFFLQYPGVKALVGGLSGSVVLQLVKMMDVFAFFEIHVASMTFTATAFLAIVPVIALYAVFGRSFCGWICPMDFLFEQAGRLMSGRSRHEDPLRKKGPALKPKAGYWMALALLGASALAGMPLFTNFLSHLTNFSRAVTGAFFAVRGLPAEIAVVVYSFGVILLLVVFDLVFPRLWCRVICPVGKTYGLFNKISIIRLRFSRQSCAGCGACDQACYMQVRISEHVEKPALRDVNCIYCGRCVEACKAKNNLITISIGGR